jgi:hypothetical protein
MLKKGKALDDTEVLSTDDKQTPKPSNKKVFEQKPCQILCLRIINFFGIDQQGK